MNVKQPKIGSDVWFYPEEGPSPQAAKVVDLPVIVADPTAKYVNLIVFGRDGVSYPATKVPFLQPDDVPDGTYAKWSE